MADFQTSLSFLLDLEGGFSSRASDRGGTTNFGITFGTFTNWRHLKGKPGPSVQELIDITQEEVEQLYREGYWNPIRGDEVEDQELATMIFSQAVNQGAGTVCKLIQRGFEVPPTLKMDDKTLALINDQPDKAKLEFFIQTQKRYVQIIMDSSPEQLANLSGWINRTHKLLRLFVGE